MLTISTLVGAFLTVFVLLQAAPAAAQGTFGDLSDKVRKGQKIIVLDEQGAVTEGTVEDVSSSTLVVNYFRGPAAPKPSAKAGRISDPSLNTTRTFKPADVRKVQKPAHLWDGAIKGAAVGLIPALIALGVDCYDCGVGGFAAFSIGVGAAAGVGIDALFGPKTLYRGDGARSRVGLAPIVGRHTHGLSATIRF